MTSDPEIAQLTEQLRKTSALQHVPDEPAWGKVIARIKCCKCPRLVGRIRETDAGPAYFAGLTPTLRRAAQDENPTRAKAGLPLAGHYLATALLDGKYLGTHTLALCPRHGPQAIRMTALDDAVRSFLERGRIPILATDFAVG